MMAGVESAWSLAMLSIALMFTGLFVFGLTAIKAKPMERGNVLPVLAGFWFPLIVFGANLNHLLTSQWLNVPGWLSFSMFFAMSFFLAWLGVVLQADATTKTDFIPSPV